MSITDIARGLCVYVHDSLLNNSLLFVCMWSALAVVCCVCVVYCPVGHGSC